MSERLGSVEPACAGESIGGRYRIERAIGRGGMGVVYSALHELTRRPVAIKLLAPWHGEHTTSFELLLNEARSAASVRHANIVDVLDMGVHDGTPFLVMELLDGSSLEAERAAAALSVAQVLSWLLPIMGALALMHERGIVHGDVKPSNIFLAGAGDARRPKLLDFGLARAYDAGLASGQLRYGTPRYMAPEHAAGEPVEAQADVWSVGVVLRECLPTDLPGALKAAIDFALEPDLSKRHATMRAFALSLVRAAMRCGVRLPLDPDPVGLPEFPAWLLMEEDAAVSELTRSVESDPALEHAHALANEVADTQPGVERAARRSRRWLAALALTLCVAPLTSGSSSLGAAPALRAGPAPTRTGTGPLLANVRDRESPLPVALPQAEETREIEVEPRARPRRATRASLGAVVRDAGGVTQRPLEQSAAELEPIESVW